MKKEKYQTNGNIRDLVSGSNAKLSVEGCEDVTISVNQGYKLRKGLLKTQKEVTKKETLLQNKTLAKKRIQSRTR